MARLLSHRSKNYYRQLLDAVPDAIVVVGATDLIELVNTRTEELFGYTRRAIVGRPLGVLIPDEPRARPNGARLARSGRREDGAAIPIEVSFGSLVTVEGTVVSAVIREIRTRPERAPDADATKHHLASALDGMQDALALFDHADRLIVCNDAYRNLIGEALPAPLVGTPYERLFDAWLNDIELPDEEERARFRAEWSSRRVRDRTATSELRLRDRRSLRLIDRRTVEGACLEIIRDVTEDVRVADELRTARAAAEAASAAKSEFLASVSHELRTPLNAILGFAQLIERDKYDGPVGERLQRRVAQVLKGGEHLARLVDDILDLARIEAGGVTMSIEPVDVRTVIREVESTLGPLAAEREIGLESSVVPPDLPPVAADRTRLLQILMNFGSNGIKYNRPSGRVTFAAQVVPGNRVRIAVRDDGLGVPEEKKDKLFQPFERAGRETTAIPGTGMGLVVTKRLAQLMHGDVGFTSVTGSGSEFWLDLPVAPYPFSTDDITSENVLPRPSSLATSMRPPWASTIRRAM